MDKDLEAAIGEHPCYSEDAHRKFARMHLPVAPGCNIQCNYCNRKYDCSNESRPGVTSEVLTPQEAAEKVAAVKEAIPELRVVAIAGPGDPLANEETFETLALVRERFPDQTLCISTNGLGLPDNAQRLYDLGVRFITVTMNAIDPGISSEIYGSVTWGGKVLRGREGAERLLANQLQGIRECIDLGIVVKINTVLIPGINDAHIPELVRKVEGMGVYIVNILPLIPVEGTAFSQRRAPTPHERKTITDMCSGNVRMMRHCRQCRADAIGMLDDDRSSEFVRDRPCGSGCGPKPTADRKDGPITIAVASEGGVDVDRGFGNAGTFRTYVHDGGFTEGIPIRISLEGAVYGDSHDRHISDIIERLGGFDVIVVREIGHRPMADLTSMGKRVVVAKGTVEDALRDAMGNG